MHSKYCLLTSSRSLNRPVSIAIQLEAVAAAAVAAPGVFASPPSVAPSLPSRNLRNSFVEGLNALITSPETVASAEAAAAAGAEGRVEASTAHSTNSTTTLTTSTELKGAADGTDADMYVDMTPTELKGAADGTDADMHADMQPTAVSGGYVNDEIVKAALAATAAAAATEAEAGAGVETCHGNAVDVDGGDPKPAGLAGSGNAAGYVNAVMVEAMREANAWAARAEVSGAAVPAPISATSTRVTEGYVNQNQIAIMLAAAAAAAENVNDNRQGSITSTTSITTTLNNAATATASSAGTLTDAAGSGAGASNAFKRKPSIVVGNRWQIPIETSSGNSKLPVASAAAMRGRSETGLISNAFAFLDDDRESNSDGSTDGDGAQSAKVSAKSKAEADTERKRLEAVWIAGNDEYDVAAESYESTPAKEMAVSGNTASRNEGAAISKDDGMGRGGSGGDGIKPRASYENQGVKGAQEGPKGNAPSSAVGLAPYKPAYTHEKVTLVPMQQQVYSVSAEPEQATIAQLQPASAAPTDALPPGPLQMGAPTDVLPPDPSSPGWYSSAAPTPTTAPPSTSTPSPFTSIAAAASASTSTTKSLPSPSSPKMWQISSYEKQLFNALDRKITPRDAMPATLRGEWKLYNRNNDVLPNAATRVSILAAESNAPRAEYINANYIKGPGGNPKHYICAMGPMDTTTDAFWQMIVQDQIKSVVMVTGLTENGKAKCTRYWPEAGATEVYGTGLYGASNSVTVTSEVPKEHDGFTTTVLNVAATATRPAARVTHFWFHSWKDHSTPKSADGITADAAPLLRVHAAVKHHQEVVEQTDAPIVIHCSAGVGRSGSFLVFDYALEALSKRNEVDVYSVIDAVRNDRVALVQHDIQCDYIHQALNAYATSHGIAIKAAGSGRPIAAPRRESQHAKSPRKLSTRSSTGGRPVLKSRGGGGSKRRTSSSAEAGGRAGVSPDPEIESLPRMSREAAEQLLQQATDQCCYLLRKKTGGVVISVANKGKISHLMVGKSNGLWIHKGTTLEGDSVREMAELFLKDGSKGGYATPVNIQDNSAA